MVKKTDIISHFYSAFKQTGLPALCVLGILMAGNPMARYDYRYATRFSILPGDSVITKDSLAATPIYPGRPMLMSLIIPGTGQAYNHDSWLKIGAMAGVEISSLVAYGVLLKKANGLQRDYENFADDNWSLSDWVTNTNNPPDSKFLEYNDFRIDGTHSLLLHLTGDLLNDYNEFVASDSLVIHPDWALNPDVSVVRDRDFYENIGKYDQFVGGWSDFTTEWLIEEKDVGGDSIEIILSTKKKDKYVEMRYENNRYLKIANYAMTATLFNHVWSAIDAVIVANRRNKEKGTEIKTDVGLLYDPHTKYGIGGISLSLQF
ncbi:MAG: hypothetical protein ACE5D8_07190 [Fidelibacterota bacterium]